MVSVCTGMLGEEGHASASVDTRLLYKPNTVNHLSIAGTIR